MMRESTIQEIAMIHDKLENAAVYEGLSPAFGKAIAWLAGQDLPSLSEGKVEIEGSDIYALVQKYKTEERSRRSFETHRKYADIQVIVKGRETIVYRQAEGLSEISAYDEAKDFSAWKLEGGLDLVLEAGEFGVFFPQDAHAPKVAPEAPADVMKVVIKVKL
jgi:YhcH/YjgK/YiaL family protein